MGGNLHKLKLLVNLEIEPETFLLWDDNANHCTTLPPLLEFDFIIIPMLSFLKVFKA